MEKRVPFGVVDALILEVRFVKVCPGSGTADLSHCPTRNLYYGERGFINDE